MMKLRRTTKYLALCLAGLLIASYNNCANHEQSSRSAASSSLSSASCDEALINQYKANVYPFFRQSTTCISCHIEGGPGLGLFASPNSDASFAAFSAAGLTKVSYMATNDQHKPPYTGAQNKPAVDAFSAKWTQHQTEYLDCVSKTQNGGINESLLTAAKKATTIYSAANVSQTLTFDLDLAEDLDATMSRGLPAKVTVDVKVLYQTIAGAVRAKGYIFSNPTLQLKDPSKQIVVEGLFFQINNQAISSQTTFTNLSRVVSGSVAMPLMPNVQANTLIEPIGTQDTFQLYFRRIVLASGTETSPPPLTPILRVADATTNSDTLLKSTRASITILRDSGITRWCLSQTAQVPASTEAACQSTATGPGTSNGWYLARPTAYDVTPGDGQKTLYLWVADQNLKISTVPAMVNILLDSTPPAAPTIGGISVTDSQVATMSVSHGNEADVAGWCVIEQNTTKANPGSPSLDDKCWNWTDESTKPTTVGFKEGGTRNVWVFVRDKAGNVSAPSNKVAATNPHGAITYTQLISSAGGARAVFYNRCFTCHGSSANPGFSKLQLFNYTAAGTIARSGVLVSRINNAVSPMPNVNGGLMPQRERDLIRLWTLPEEGETPLP